jgi:hypothetical protein
MKLLSLLILAFTVSTAASPDDGVVKVRSTYPMSETIDRIKQDVAGKGITFFSAIDQSRLAANAGIELRPSTLLILFGAQTRSRASIDRCGCWCSRMPTARYGPPTPTSPGSRAATTEGRGDRRDRVNRLDGALPSDWRRDGGSALTA